MVLGWREVRGKDPVPEVNQSREEHCAGDSETSSNGNISETPVTGMPVSIVMTETWRG